ncbi:Gfo/Idh/MocA family protein [Liquorilactobacillus sicerae]|uniref:Gfo/Idh/MocA family protein n=1 Tax=Liquorilactobacillus sicerae TaxID=1416943 RepID=UPI00247FE100|nr:Gfo/Idh/MocA family oxidoreductase [Liquorilactobacillus sicerae]
MKKYNWSIIGSGWIAGEMADALQAVNGEIYAVSARNQTKLKQFAQAKGIKKVFADPLDMINDPQTDVVYIATPHITHYQFIKAALAAGKHVFCEKAITINDQQFNEVEELARQKHLLLTEGFTLFHMPLYQQVQTLIKAGNLGKIKMIQVNFGSLKAYDPHNRFFDPQLAGGALLDIGGYAAAFARLFLSQQPNNLLTTVDFADSGVDEQSGIILKNSAGQLAVISLSFRAKQPKRGVVSGTKGFLEINNFPRATTAQVTYTADAHQQQQQAITVGDEQRALEYEVEDFQRYLTQGHDDGQLALSHDIAQILSSVRTAWGLKFPGE